MVPGAGMAALAGRRVVAFAGIGRPGKFFATLRQAGIEVVAEAGFADHHFYRAAEIFALRRRAQSLGAALVTTSKDFARLDKSLREDVVALAAQVVWEDEPAVAAFFMKPGAWGSGFAPPAGSGAEPQLFW